MAISLAGVKKPRRSGGPSGGGGCAGGVPAAAVTAAYAAVSPRAPPLGSASATSKNCLTCFLPWSNTTASSAWETAGLSSLGGRGRSETCFRATVTGDSPSNGTRPVSASYSSTPTE